VLGRLTTSSALGVLVACTALVGPHEEPTRASYSATGFSEAQVALIDRAIGRYADAGLELPPLEFVRYPTRDPCRGARGFYAGDRPQATIRICTLEAGRFAESLFLHEVAHAWDAYALTARRREAFLELRNLEQWWDDGSAPWHTYGAEHAAQILVWGLIGRPIRIATIPDTSCVELRAGYVLLTGGPPSHGDTDLCDEGGSADSIREPAIVRATTTCWVCSVLSKMS
jgi:hypothetical protein